MGRVPSKFMGGSDQTDARLRQAGGDKGGGDQHRSDGHDLAVRSDELAELRAQRPEHSDGEQARADARADDEPHRRL